MQSCAKWRTGTLVLGLLLPLAAVADGVAADGGIRGLTPAQRDGVQHVGQALLLAKRTANAPTDLVELRAKVERFHNAVADLGAPVRTTTLTLTNASQSTAPQAKTWREARSVDIEHLYQAAAALRQRSRSSGTAAIPFGDNEAMRSIYAMLPDVADDIVVSDSIVATKASRQRIEHLHTDIDAALALPVAQRQQRLLELADEFQLRKHPSVQIAGSVAEAPTLSARTEHRRGQ